MKGVQTTREKGLAEAVRLQRFADPLDWRKNVDAIEDPEARAVADEYLRGILIRMKAQKAAKAGPEVQSKWRERR